MRTLALFLIGLTFGAAGGFVVAAANGITFDGHDHGAAAQHGEHAMTGMDHANMHDQPLELDIGSAPDLNILVIKDPMAGYNLHVIVAGFSFAPQSASLDHKNGEGHAHVYINGAKHGRLYGPWLHLDKLPVGDVEIKVTLNSNDHRPLAVNGSVIKAVTTLSVE